MPGKRMVVTPLTTLSTPAQYPYARGLLKDRKQFETNTCGMKVAVEVPELYAAIDESAVTIGKVSEPVEG
ncbi:MAG: hypothetical protein ACLR2M_00625 [Varibaculum sp.]